MKPKKKRVVFAVNQQDIDRLTHLSHFIGVQLEQAPDLSVTIRNALSLLQFYLRYAEFYLDDENQPVVLVVSAADSDLPNDKRLLFNIAPDDDIKLVQLGYKLGVRLGQPMDLTQLLRHAVTFFAYYASSVQKGHKFYCRNDKGELQTVKASWEHWKA